MTSALTSRQSIHYPSATVKRADRAMRCAPFRLALFTDMVYQSVSLKAIADSDGTPASYTRRPLSELSAESELLWLIQVGLLRREVDGQGLTDSFRVTPLGRRLVQKWQERGNTAEYLPDWRDRVLNHWNRWARLPLP